MSIVRFKPICVFYGNKSEVLRPYETATDLSFLVNGGIDIGRCVRLDKLCPIKLLAKLPFDVPRDCYVHIGREQVDWDGTSLEAYTGGPLEEVAWDGEIRPGDRVEFRDRDSDVADITNPQLPRWDSDRRELWYGNNLIKLFKYQKDTNQEIILKSFDELGWPGRIDDPLPSKVGSTTQKRRLADTIDAINENHKTEGVIHFRGDGTAKGVIWEVVRG